MISSTILLTSELLASQQIDVTSIGALTGLLWHDQKLSIAGIGEAQRILLDRPRGAEDAQAALAGMSGSDYVGRPGSGPVAFSAMPFDRTQKAELIVPEVILAEGSDGVQWLTLVQDQPATDLNFAEALERVQKLLDPTPAGPNPTKLSLTSVIEPEAWRDMVGQAVARINETPDGPRANSGEDDGGRISPNTSVGLNKVVLARELIVSTDHPVPPADVLQRLRRTFSTAILFCVEGFLGASPELLAARTGDLVWAHPLAGTAPRGADAADDDRLAAELLASTKNQWEHRITIDWLLGTLLPFCSYVDAEPEPSIVSLANVHHLGTRVEGRLSSPPASILELVSALHPTPAVGGDPQDEALALIDEIEGADRGRYAGPVGWLDGAGNGAFAVGIRSATLTSTSSANSAKGSELPNQYRVFAGVGVVGDSDPQAELDETRSKFQAMLSALIQL